MRTQFRLKLLGSQPMAAATVSTIIGRAADVCVYVGRVDELELQVFIHRIESGSLEILYLLADQADAGNALAKLAFELLVADIVAAFSVMRLATGSDGAPRPLPGPAATAMADVLEAVEEDEAIEGWSVRAGRASAVRRTRTELFELRGALGGPKDVQFKPKTHIQVQQQFPGFPRPTWVITWANDQAWETARVAAPIDGSIDVTRYDKLVVDLEIHELMSKGSAPSKEVFVRRVYWEESSER